MEGRGDYCPAYDIGWYVIGVVLSDGCTGFWFLERFFNIRQCCVVHDAGGSDWLLTNCLWENTPGWAVAPVALCVAVMILFRPVYRWFKK